MSEGKSAVITLSPEARRRIALERERRALRGIRSRLAGLHDEADQIRSDYGIEVEVDQTVPSHPEDPGAIHDVVLQLQARALSARAELDSTVSEAVERRETSHQASLEGVSVAASEVLEDRKRPESTDRPSISDQRIATASQNASQALDQLHPAAPNELRDRLQGQVRSIAESLAASEAESIATEVMTTVHETNAQMRTTLERVDELRASLLSSAVDEAADLLTWLERVSTGKAALDLGKLERVEKLVQAEEREEESRFVTAAAADVFQSFGYEIETGFSSLLETTGDAMVRRPEWGGHAVMVRREDEGLTMKLERTVDSSAGVAFDVAAQSQFCSDYERLEAAMESRGIEFESKKTPPGVIASARAERLPVGFATRKEESELRQREIGGPR